MKTLILVLVLVTGTIGCAHRSKMNDVALGMTKAEVIKVMGTPGRTSAQGGAEYLMYSLYTMGGPWKDHFVKLIDGKVESYGRLGDFDSTKDPTTNIKIEQISSGPSN